MLDIFVRESLAAWTLRKANALSKCLVIGLAIGRVECGDWVSAFDANRHVALHPQPSCTCGVTVYEVEMAQDVVQSVDKRVFDSLEELNRLSLDASGRNFTAPTQRKGTARCILKAFSLRDQAPTGLQVNAASIGTGWALPRTAGKRDW